NDPEKRTLRLLVKGRITPSLRIVPENWSFIDFNRVRPGEAVSREIKVLSAQHPTFTLKAALNNPALEVRATPLPAGSGAGDYRSGYRVVVRTTPGLTSGFLRETLSLEVN